jgi:DNA repair exonuclease SbcCD ATPase subunit
MKNQFDIVLDATKCQLQKTELMKENAALHQKNVELSLFVQENGMKEIKTTEFMRKNEALEKEVTALKERLEKQRDEMQKKHEKELKQKLDSMEQKLEQNLEAKLNVINNKFVNNLQKEVQEFYDSIPK